MTTADVFQLLSRGAGSIPLEQPTVIGVENDNSNDFRVPGQLIGGSNHFEDVPREIREVRWRGYNDVRLPRE